MDWARLIDAPTSEIHRLARDLNLPEPKRKYAQILSSYLQGDIEKLAERVNALGPSDGELRELGELRLLIRRRQLKQKTLFALSERTFTHLFEAEKLFCLALGWEILGNDHMTCEFFTRAAASYRAQGCPSKGLRAHYNAVAAESRVTPHKNFIAEYQAVLEEAKAIADTGFAGFALSMLAREYQVAGLLEKSLVMANESILMLEPERGTIHYFLALLQKANTLVDLGRGGEIEELLAEADLAPFPAIHAAKTLLRVSLDSSLTWDPELEKEMTPSWRNRVPLLLNRRAKGIAPATELERSLLRLTYNGPIEKWDLIARLYPGESDSLAVENRFKNLLARVRKKYPVTCDDGRYHLAKMPPEEKTV